MGYQYGRSTIHQVLAAIMMPILGRVGKSGEIPTFAHILGQFVIFIHAKLFLIHRREKSQYSTCGAWTYVLLLTRKLCRRYLDGQPRKKTSLEEILGRRLASAESLAKSLTKSLTESLGQSLG